MDRFLACAILRKFLDKFIGDRRKEYGDILAPIMLWLNDPEQHVQKVDVDEIARRTQQIIDVAMRIVKEGDSIADIVPRAAMLVRACEREAGMDGAKPC